MTEKSGPIFVPSTCPNCGAQRGGKFGVHWNSLSVWCLNCKWGRNHDGKSSTMACDGWAPSLTPWQQDLVDRAVEAHRRGERLVVSFPRHGGRSQIARAIEKALGK